MIISFNRPLWLCFCIQNWGIKLTKLSFFILQLLPSPSINCHTPRDGSINMDRERLQKTEDVLLWRRRAEVDSSLHTDSRQDTNEDCQRDINSCMSQNNQCQQRQNTKTTRNVSKSIPYLVFPFMWEKGGRLQQFYLHFLWHIQKKKKKHYFFLKAIKEGTFIWRRRRVIV